MTLLTILAALILVAIIGVYRSIGALHLYVRESDRVNALELSLIREDIADAREDTEMWVCVTRQYLGSMIEKELFPFLGIPETPAWMELDERQTILRRQILSDSELAAHWGIKDEEHRKRLYAEMVEKGEGVAPWEVTHETGNG